MDVEWHAFHLELKDMTLEGLDSFSELGSMTAPG